MYIIAQKKYLLGNRLFLSSHILANAIEFRQSYFNGSFDEYAHYFEGTHRDLFCRYPLHQTPAFLNTHQNRERLYQFVHRIANSLATGRLRRFSGTYARVFRTDWVNTFGGNTSLVLNLRSSEFQESRRTPLVFFQGPHFQDPESLFAHKQVIRGYYTPIAPIRNRIQKRMEEIRQQAQTVIGIHIRLGDYNRFENGRFYYSIEQYRALILRMRGLLDDPRIHFLISCNEPLDIQDFPGLDISLAPGHLIEDMYLLAKCDYIIGPPSTYSAWASFFGSVKLYWVRDPQKKFSLDDFEVM